MIIVPEREIAGLVTAADCFAAVEKVFASMAKKSAYNFPVIREAIGHADALYGFEVVHAGQQVDSLPPGRRAGFRGAPGACRGAGDGPRDPRSRNRRRPEIPC